MKVIILAAGKGSGIEGFNKILLRNPGTNRTILDEYLAFFAEEEITVVVGYNSLNIMMAHPELNYVYNPDWNFTANSYSLFLALSEEPCLILSGDFFINETVIAELKNHPAENLVVVKNTENRSPKALNCSLEAGRVVSIYQGSMKANDPEAIGVYKIGQPAVIKKLRRNCLDHPHLMMGLNLPLDMSPVDSLLVKNDALIEINSPLDYINFIKRQ
jgi:choline kinase